jgi:hypothetical protein
MTRGASHAFGNVNGMVEVDVAWEIMNSIPTDGTTLCETCPHGREHFCIGPDLRMARHAGLRRWQPGETRLLDGGVAVSAIDSEAADVMLMAERHRLVSGDVLLGYVWRTADRIR